MVPRHIVGDIFRDSDGVGMVLMENPAATQQTLTQMQLMGARAISRSKGQHKNQPVEVTAGGGLKIALISDPSSQMLRLGSLTLGVVGGTAASKLIYTATENISAVRVHVCSIHATLMTTFNLYHSDGTVPADAAAPLDVYAISKNTPLGVGGMIEIGGFGMKCGEKLLAYSNTATAINVTLYGIPGVQEA